MAISFESPAAVALIVDAKARLMGLAGVSLNFVRLCKIFGLEENQGRMAELTELFCNRHVKLMKHVYFYLDDEYGPVMLKDGVVKHYLKFDQLFHPVTNSVIEGVEVEERVLIEFEVLE